MSGAVIRTVEMEDGSVTYDSNMPMGALRAVFNAAKAGDLDQLMAGMAAIITSWPYEGDPTDPDSWDAVRRSEFNDLTEAVLGDLGEIGK